jgi:aspartate/methionine/tyrosine aminotransferase
VARVKETGRPLLDLTVSNPTQVGLPYAAESILEALHDAGALVYQPDPLGLLAARSAVATEYRGLGLAVQPSQVLLTASTSEAYAFLFKLLCDPGDEVLVPRPSYPLLEHLARLDSVRLVPYQLSYDGAWAIDLGSVRRARSRHSRALVVVNPNNPTGNYLKRGELAALAEFGLPLIADEVFVSYALTVDRQRVSSALAAEHGLVFALGGLSKLAALPQLKLAWTVACGPQALVVEALARLELIADAYLSVGTAVQLALPKLLALRDATHGAVRDRCARNLAYLREQSAASVVTTLHAEGGWQAVVRLPRLATEEAWAVGLLEQQGVIVQPGWFYDFPNEPFAVLSLLTPEQAWREGVQRLISHAGKLAG